jgi:hypothetical protein
MEAVVKTKKEEEYHEKLVEHKELVKECMQKLAAVVRRRGEIHDDSKLDEPEFAIMAKEFNGLSNTTYGSDEYKKLLEKIKPALDCHYAKNRHHPEHHPEGIKGMNLVDLVEMFCDWYAATNKHDDGNIKYSIEHNKKRFNYTKELEQIFKNTIELLDIKLEK